MNESNDIIIMNLQERRRAMFARIITHQRGNCFQRQAMIYALGVIMKQSEELRDQLTPIIITLLEDDIVNVRFSCLMVISRLQFVNQDIKFALSSLINKETDDDTRELAEDLYASLCQSKSVQV